jgi:carboxylesterase type B
MTTTIKTAFGVFRGKKGDAVTQYRGIKYASLKTQLSVSTMVEHYGNEIIDATEFG